MPKQYVRGTWVGGWNGHPRRSTFRKAPKRAHASCLSTLVITVAIVLAVIYAR